MRGRGAAADISKVLVSPGGFLGPGSCLLLTKPRVGSAERVQLEGEAGLFRQDKEDSSVSC